MKVRQFRKNMILNIVFATGAPVSNSISRLYAMMNYIQPDILKTLSSWSYFDS